jgi:hypothetical protein
MVLAVEAVEGTDETSGGRTAGKRDVMVIGVQAHPGPPFGSPGHRVHDG